MPQSDQSHPFATFPATPGKGLNGLRPYYTPGLTTDNYTAFAGQPPTAPISYYAAENDDLIDSSAAARELVNFSILKYLTTAISCPFDVSNTLLQVQYLPREDAEVSETMTQPSSDNGQEEDEEEEEYDPYGAAEEEEDEEEDSEEEEEFFDDSKRRRRRSSTQAPGPSGATLDYTNPEFSQQMPLDESGYIVRKSVYDDDTRPSYQMKPIEGGVWQGIGRLMKHPHEGWRALFKGQYTNWVYEILHLFLQPTLEGSLNDMFDLYDDTIPLVHLDRVGPNLATLVGSNLIVGFILSPLELVRTR